MRKYCTFQLIFFLLIISISYFTWGTNNSHFTQIVCFIVSLIVAIITLLAVRDKFLKEMRNVDPKAYKKMIDISEYGKVYNVNIDKTFPYNPKAQELISWWYRYTWMAFISILVPFILLILS